MVPLTDPQLGGHRDLPSREHPLEVLYGNPREVSVWFCSRQSWRRGWEGEGRYQEGRRGHLWRAQGGPLPFPISLEWLFLQQAQFRESLGKLSFECHLTQVTVDWRRVGHQIREHIYYLYIKAWAHSRTGLWGWVSSRRLSCRVMKICGPAETTMRQKHKQVRTVGRETRGGRAR